MNASATSLEVPTVGGPSLQTKTTPTLRDLTDCIEQSIVTDDSRQKNRYVPRLTDVSCTEEPGPSLISRMGFFKSSTAKSTINLDIHYVPLCPSGQAAGSEVHVRDDLLNKPLSEVNAVTVHEMLHHGLRGQDRAYFVVNEDSHVSVWPKWSRFSTEAGGDETSVEAGGDESSVEAGGDETMNSNEKAASTHWDAPSKAESTITTLVEITEATETPRKLAATIRIHVGTPVPSRGKKG